MKISNIYNASIFLVTGTVLQCLPDKRRPPLILEIYVVNHQITLFICQKSPPLPRGINKTKEINLDFYRCYDDIFSIMKTA